MPKFYYMTRQNPSRDMASSNELQGAAVKQVKRLVNLFQIINHSSAFNERLVRFKLKRQIIFISFAFDFCRDPGFNTTYLNGMMYENNRMKRKK